MRRWWKRNKQATKQHAIICRKTSSARSIPLERFFVFSPFRLSLASFSSLKVIFASFWLSVCYRCRVCSICFVFFSSSSSRLHLFCFASSIAGRDRAMETRPGCCQCCAYGGTMSSEFLGAHLEAAAAGAGPSVKQLQYVFISRLASLPYRPSLDNSCWTAQRICIFAGILVTHHRPAEGLVADDDEGRRAGLESKSGCDKWRRPVRPVCTRSFGNGIEPKGRTTRQTFHHARASPAWCSPNPVALLHQHKHRNR